MKLEIESEKVLELAKEYPEWKKGLEKLFPEAFRNTVRQPQLKAENLEFEQEDGDLVRVRDKLGGGTICWISLGSLGPENCTLKRTLSYGDFFISI